MITAQANNSQAFKSANFSKCFRVIKAIKQLPFITINSISQLTCSIAVTQGNSRYLGGFGITKPTDVINVELDVEKRMQAEVLKR